MTTTNLVVSKTYRVTFQFCIPIRNLMSLAYSKACRPMQAMVIYKAQKQLCPDSRNHNDSCRIQTQNLQVTSEVYYPVDTGCSLFL